MRLCTIKIHFHDILFILVQPICLTCIRDLHESQKKEAKEWKRNTTTSHCAAITPTKWKMWWCNNDLAATTAAAVAARTFRAHFNQWTLKLYMIFKWDFIFVRNNNKFIKARTNNRRICDKVICICLLYHTFVHDINTHHSMAIKINIYITCCIHTFVGLFVRFRGVCCFLKKKKSKQSCS